MAKDYCNLEKVFWSFTNGCNEANYWKMVLHVFFLPGPCLAEVHHANRGCDAKQSSGSVWMVGAFLKEDLQHLSRVRGGRRESELLSQEFSEGMSRNG